MGNRKLEQQEREFLGRCFRALRVFLSELRAERRLTQEEVSLRGEMDRKAIGGIERGQVDPRFSTLLLVARGFGMSPAAFFRARDEHIEGRAKGDRVLRAERYDAPDGSHWVEIRYGLGPMKRPRDGGKNRPPTGPT